MAGFNRLGMVFFLLISVISGQNSYHIKAGRLFDSERGRFLANQQILVEGDTISAIGRTVKAPAGVTVIDLSDKTVLPGLIDSHTHLVHNYRLDINHRIRSFLEVIFDGDALRALKGAEHARSYLDAGITTVKDLGNSGQFIDVALKTAIHDGHVPGPRMFVSGPIISAQGGQWKGPRPWYSDIVEVEYRVVSGPDEAMAAVRENITYGADLIKIVVDGVTNLTVAEIRAMVATAHDHGIKLTAHAASDKAVQSALDGGVDGIEHGNRVTEKTLRRMAKAGVPLVLTINEGALYKNFFLRTRPDSDIEAIVAERVDRNRALLDKIKKTGVSLVAGSDIIYDFPGPRGSVSIGMLVAYVDAGLSPVQALKSATSNAAAFLGKPDKLGVIKQGAFADIIAVKGDLEQDFTQAIRSVVFVMKAGTIYKQ